MDKRSFHTQDIDPRMLYRLMTGIVAPRPIAVVSSCSSSGDVNLAPYSFFNVVSVCPPILVFSPLRTFRKNELKDTLSNVRQLPEVVINVLGYEQVQQLSIAGDNYDSGVNEFEKSGLTPIAADVVAPPLVKEALASFECKVNNVLAFGDTGGAGNLVVCEVLKTHFRSALIEGDFYLNTNESQLIGRLGKSDYIKVSSEAIFEVVKDAEKKAIGWDNLPTEIAESSFFTGNEIAKLASVSKIPVNVDQKIIFNQSVLNRARSLLSENNITAAWQALYR